MTWTDNTQNQRSKCPQIYNISWTLSMIKEIQVKTMRGHFLPVRIRKGSNSDYSQFVVKSFSRVQHFATPWTAACQASLSFTISQCLLKLMSTESAMPSNLLILSHPLLLWSSIFPSIRVFSSESSLHIRWSKYWSFSISPSNEYSGLISFRLWYSF